MVIDCVVVNASPLICLFKSSLVDLFPALFKNVAVPEAVIKEVMAKGTADFAAQTLMPHGAPQSMKISTPTPPLPPQRGRVRGGSICVLNLNFK